MNQNIWAWRIGLVGWLIGAIASFPQGVKAQVVPDDTLGAERSQVRPDTIQGVESDRISGGATRGANLFHSFSQFSILQGHGAYFENPVGIQNIFSRVTGAERSNIDGRLGVLGNANLFLINPNGIVFGRNATLDVGGSFVGTTANAIGFGTGGAFSATLPEAPSDLLAIDPSAFLFSQIPVGNIANSSIAPTGAVTPSGLDVLGLRVPDGQNLLLLGGDITMNGGNLNALGGRIELGGLAATGAIGLDTTGNIFRLSFPANALLSNLTLANDARVSTRGNGGGDIVVNTNGFNATAGGRLVTGTEGVRNAGDIAVNSKEFNISGTNPDGLRSGLYNQVVGISSGNSGNINVNTQSFNASLGAGIVDTVQSGAIGNAGNISIKTESLLLSGAATLESSTYGRGNAGNLSVQANSVALSGNSYIFNNVESGAIGNGGLIDITSNTLSLADGSQIQSILREANTATRLTGGRGNAGSIHINVRNTFTARGVDNAGLSSGVFSSVNSGAEGSGGNINLTAGLLVLEDRAGLNSGTYGRGNAGNLSVQANSMALSGSSTVASNVEAGAIGNGGLIDITSNTLSLADGSQIQSILREANTATRLTGGRGNAGSIHINVRNTFTARGVDNAGLSSGVFSSVNSGAEGSGGNINLTAGLLVLEDRAGLNSGTYGRGNAGNLSVQANSMALSGSSTVASNVEAGAIGNGGLIDITSNTLSLADGSQIQSILREANTATRLTGGRGNAGSIHINVRNTFTARGVDNAGLLSGVLSSVNSGAEGSGGNINLTARSLALEDGARLDSSTSGRGSAGDLSIRAHNVTLNNSSIFSNVESGAIGNGGVVDITTDVFSLTRGSQIQTLLRGANAATGLAEGHGNAGNVKISGRSVEISGGSIIFSVSLGLGNAGNVNIQATDTLSFLGRSLNNVPSGILSNIVGATGRGNSGNIQLKARRIFLANGAQVATNNLFGQGNAGNLTINATDSLYMTNESAFQTSTSGKGNAGNIEIHAGSVSLLGRGIFASVNSGARGNGGDISIRAGSLSLNSLANSSNSRSDISTSTSGHGNAGSINLQIERNINLTRQAYVSSTVLGSGQGQAGDVNIQARSLTLQDGAQVAASVFRTENGNPGGRGRGGTVRINAPDFVIVTGLGLRGLSSGIYADTERGARGQGGDIFITTGALRVADGAVITTQTLNPSNGGDITINARTFDASGGGQVLANSFSGGNAGNVTMNVYDRATLSGRDRGYTRRLGRYGRDIVSNISPFSGVFATTEGTDSTGNGGRIVINATNLNLTDGARITAQSKGSGRAGDITLNASRQLNATDSTIATSATKSSGGNININRDTAFGAVVLQDSDIITDSKGNGGNINIRGAGTIAFGDSDILAGSIQENGGDISLGRYFGQGQTRLPTSAPFRNDGQPDVNAQGNRTSGEVSTTDTNFIQNSLNELSVDSIDTGTLLSNSCIVRDRQQGSFRVTGSDNFPERPGNDNASPYPTGTIRSIPTDGSANPQTNRPWQIGDPIVEPQGVYRLPDGRLVMSRECSQSNLESELK